MTNRHLGKKSRQKRLRKYQSPVGSRDAQTETSFEQEKHRTGRPSLRGAGHRIKRRSFPGPPRETAKQFRQTMQIEEKTGVEQTCKNHRGGAFQVVARKSRSNY